MRPLPLILLAMFVLATPGRSRAQPAALALPTRLPAGEAVDVRWSGLPAGVREVELELSLDGGRWVRISPELEAVEGRFTWRVPSLASARARLRLRAGGEGFEQVVAQSAELRIAEDSGEGSTRRPALAAGEDWWRLGEHANGPDPRLDASGATLAGAVEHGAFAPAPEPDPLPPPAPHLSSRHAQPAPPAMPPAPSQAPPTARRHPLRN